MISKFVGIESLTAQICGDVHFLAPCEKYTCIHVCERVHGYNSHGICRNAVTCKCFYDCYPKDENHSSREDSRLLSHPNGAPRNSPTVN